MDPTIPRPWLTADEAAAYLQVTVRTLDRYREAGLLPAYRLGGRRAVRFRTDELDALAEPITSTRAGAPDATP